MHGSIVPCSPLEDMDWSSTAAVYGESLEPSCLTRRCPHPAAEWKYYFCEEPNTLEVEDMKHEMLIQLCGDTIFAPVKPMLGASSHIFDMGAGSGMWTIDGEQRYLTSSTTQPPCLPPTTVAVEFPEVEVFGMDYKPLGPQFIPPNLNFFCDDVDKDWLLNAMLSTGRTVDYIHAREMIFAVKDWGPFMDQSFKYV